MTVLKYIVGAGDHRCPDDVDMTALKYIASSAVLGRGAQKLWAIWRKVRLSRDEGCFAWWAGERGK